MVRLFAAVIASIAYTQQALQTSSASLEGKSFDDGHKISSSNKNLKNSALGVPIGNALLISGLRSEVPKLAPGISPQAVIRNGALGVQSLTASPSLLHGLREAYAIAISHVNIFLVVLICISVPTACGMEWLNIKEVSKKNETEKKEKKEKSEG